MLSAVALVLTLRGIPELYYGDEIGMTGGRDPDNRQDFPGGWPGDTQNGFTQTGRTTEQQRIFLATQKLLKLRREHAALRTGKLFHLFSDDGAYVFLRQTDDERVAVVFNGGTAAREVLIPQSNTPAEHALRTRLLYGEAMATTNGEELRITAPAQSVSIFSLD
jgi:glycosidase